MKFAQLLYLTPMDTHTIVLSLHADTLTIQL